ncbi:hypothetical protein BX616_001930 [Lobosporangium transversale]|uniref:WD40-repeat-containing domain protein n=1 Tax=Lobosporangium transversale TaxID=64571 RepID=A0A1Y2GCC2_9FUNG|nr:WD40-repeat-containing domain protein [Lobosporangium transversale]KAF9917109.1 hypothetical protein BX616_001930 [Lobosporangium transversale]ORZ05892.1 WD40-repeat-containing domain protein [Lobosporangium transversale]|eukprot:XP_021877273.1 WD40-repeat-containing domain protein [Lobosporangium transversale]
MAGLYPHPSHLNLVQVRKEEVHYAMKRHVTDFETDTDCATVTTTTITPTAEIAVTMTMASVSTSTPALPGTAPKPNLTAARCHISKLPAELAFIILTYLPYRSLVALSRVDRHWRQSTFQRDYILWYKLCIRHGFIPLAAAGENNTTDASVNNSCGLYRLHLQDVQSQLPGLARALLQSSRRISSSSTSSSQQSSPGALSGTSSPLLVDLNDDSSIEQHTTKKKRMCISTLNSTSSFSPPSQPFQGRVESWRDYFEVMMTLERKWIEGKPNIRSLREHTEAVLCVKILPQSNRIVSGDRLGYLKVWCALTGVCLKTFKHHMMGISSLVMQDDILVSGSWDSTIIIWRQLQEAPYLKPSKVVDLGEQVMSMDLDSNMDLVIGAVSGLVKVFSIKTLSSMNTFRSPLPHLCTAVSLSNTKVEAAIGLNYYAWDRASNAQVGFIGDAHFDNISCMKVDVGKRLIFTGSLDSKVRIFSWETKPMLLRQYGGHRSGVRCMALRDNMIITGSTDKTCLITFRGRHESYRSDATTPLDGVQDGYEDETEHIAQPVSLLNQSYVNAVDADTSMVVTGAEDGVVRIFDFGCDLWKPPTPSSPTLCGQASLISSTSSTCVLMARPGRNKISVGNRRQTWGTSALAVLTRARSILSESLAQHNIDQDSSKTTPLAWMNVDEIYQRMIEWELQPVRLV